MLGGSIALKGATLDASGTTGGGSVRVGGDFHGAGALAHAATTTLDAATTIRADATGATGDGGTVVLWSDAATVFTGQISARGGSAGGNGGSVEVSSANALGYNGGVDLGAARGTVGSLLLDPHNILISDDATDPATLVSATDGTIAPVLFANLPTTDFTINAGALGIALGKAAVTLQANNNITLAASVTQVTPTTAPPPAAQAGNLTLQAGNTITFNQNVGLTILGTLTATFNDEHALVAGRDAATTDGTPLLGSFVMGAGSSILAVRGIGITGGSFRALPTTPILIGPATLTKLQATSPAGSLSSGNIVVTNTTGTQGITVTGGLVTSIFTPASTPGGITGGSVSLNTTGPLSVNGINAVANPTLGTGMISLTGSAITLNNPVAGNVLTTNGPVTFTGGATPVETIGGQTYNNDVTLNQSTTTLMSDRGTITFNGRVDGTSAAGDGNSLVVNAYADEIFNAPVGSQVALRNLSTDTVTGNGTGGAQFNLALPAATAAHQAGVYLDGDLTINDNALLNVASTTIPGIHTGGAQTYNRQTTLGADTFLESGSTLGFVGAVGSSSSITHVLALTTGGDITFGGTVSGLSALTTVGGQNINLNGGAVTTTGDQKYSGPVVLNATPGGSPAPAVGTTTLTASAGSVSFASTVTAATTATLPQALSLAVSGQAIFAGSVGTAAVPLASLVVTNGGTGGNATFNGGDVVVTTTGNQSYPGVLTVNSTTATTLTSKSGTVTAGSVSGTGAALNVNATGSTFGKIDLSAGKVTFGLAGGLATFNGAINAQSFTRNGAGETDFNGGTVTTSGGGQGFGTGALVLGADTTLTDNGSGAITLQGAVRSSDNQTWAFTVLTNGNTTFGGPVGTTDHPLGRLTVGSASFANGSTYFNVNPAAPAVSTINRGVGNNDGTQTYYSAVFLTQNTVLQSTKAANAPDGTVEANIDFKSTVDTDAASATARSVTVNTSGSEFFRGLIGNNRPLLGLSTDVASATYTADAQGQAQFLMTLPTTLPAGKTVVAGVNTLTGGVTTRDSAVFGVANSSSYRVPTTVSGLPSLNTPTVTTTGAQTYSDGVLLTLNTVLQGTTLSANGITGSPATGVPAPNLTLDLSGQAVNVPFGITVPTFPVPTFIAFNSFGNVTGINGFASVGDGGTRLSGAVSFPGYQYYYGNPATPATGVTLTADTLLTSTGNANIGFGGILNGGFNLTVATAGDTYFDGLVGNTAAVTGIAVSNPGGTTHFDMNLTGQAAGTAGVNLGNGGLAIANRVDFSAPGSVSDTLPTVRTTGAQVYTGAATLGQNAVLTNTTGGAITFNGTVNGAHALTLNTAGNEFFYQSVGAGTPLLSLSTDDDLNYRGGTVYFGDPANPNATFVVNTLNNAATAGSAPQMYNDNVALRALTTTLTTQSNFGGSGILFGGTVEADGLGIRTLTLNTPDTVTFNGTVGVNSALTALTITAPGGTLFNNAAGVSGLAANKADVNLGFGGLTITGPVKFSIADSTLTTSLHPTVLSTGAQRYNGPVTLAGPTSLYVIGTGGISLNGTVDGAFGLALNTPGDEIFGGVIGGTTALTSLATDNFVNVTVAGQAQFVFSAAGQPAGVRVGAGGLSIHDSVLFNVTGTTLARPTVLVFGGGTQSYGLAANLSASTFLVGTDSATQATASTYTGGGAVAFGSAITGSIAAPNLTIRTGAGPTVLGGAINVGQVNVTGALVTVGGAITGLNLLSIAPNDGTPGPISLNGGLLGGSVISANGQTYGSAVTLTANTILTDLKGSDITFTSKLDGAYHLTINTAGATTFGGPVGGDTALLSVNTDAPGVTYINGGSVRTGYSLLNAGPYGQFYGDRVVLGADTVLSADTQGVGVVIFSDRVDSFSTAVPFSLDVAGVTVIFGGPVGGVGAVGAPLRSLTVTGAVQTVLNAGSVTTTTFQSYGSELGTVIGKPTVLNAGTDLGFLGKVDGNGGSPDTSLTLNAPGQLLFAGAVGLTTPLTSLTVNGGTLALNGGLVSTVGDQSYNAAVNLGAGTLLASSGNGRITFATTLDGAFDLVVNTGGLTAFRGKIGGATALASLTTDDEGQAGEGTRFDLDAAADSTNAAGVNVTGSVTIRDAVNFNIANASTANPSVQTAVGSQTYGGIATLETGTVLTSTNGGDLVFSKTLDGAFTLALNTAGTTRFDGLVGGLAALASLTTDADGTTRINGGGIITQGSPLANGAQRYNDAVVLGANTLLVSLPRTTAAVGGPIRFNGMVDGAFTLTVNTSGQTIFNDLVGSKTALAGLTTDNGGGAGEGTQFNGSVGPATAGVTVNGAVAINDSVTFNVAGSTLAQPTVLTLGNGAQTYAGAVSLAANTVLTSASGLPGAGGAFAGGGAIRLDSPEGVVSTGGSDLSIRAGTGTATFASTINVGSLDLGGALVSIQGPVALPGLLSVEPNGGGTGGTLVLNGGTLTTSGTQTYNAGVILGGNTTLASLGTSGGAVTFNSTLDGPFALMLNTPGDEVFNGFVGSQTPLASLETDLAGTVGGAARFNMDASGAAAGVNVAGRVLIHDAVVFNVAGVSLTAGAPVSVLSGGPQAYAGAATLAQNTALTSTGAGGFIFSSTVDGAFGLALSSPGDELFFGLVGSTTALTSLTTDTDARYQGGAAKFILDLTGTAPGTAGVNVAGPVTINDRVIFDVANSTVSNPTVRTTGAQTYNGTAVLAADTTLGAAGNANVVFNSTVDGPFALTLNAGGQTIFNGPVGGMTALQSLTVSGGGGATLLNAGIVNTVGAQFYGNAVQLAQNTVLTSLNPAATGGGLTFDGKVNGTYALTLVAPGAVTFNSAVGDGAPLFNLTVAGGGAATLLNAGTVKTTGLQFYGNAVVLQRGTLLTSTSIANGGISFDGTINGPQALTLMTPGVVTLNGEVGTGTALQNLTISSGGVATLLNAGTIITTGLQSYGNAVQLQRATDLTSNAPTGGGLTFSSTVNGAQALTLTALGAVTFNGAVGNSAPLLSLVVSGGGAATQINAGTVTTTGLQSYGSAVNLLRTTLLTSSSAGNIVFGAALDGARDLTLTTQGAVAFNGEVGTGAALQSLTISSGGAATLLNGGEVTTTGLQDYGNAVQLQQDTTLASTNAATSAGGLTFDGAITGGRSLTLNSANRIVFNGEVGSATGPTLTRLTTLGGGLTIFDKNGGKVTTTGVQRYNNPVRLRVDGTFASAGDITFSSTVDGKAALAVNTPGQTLFGGQVGGTVGGLVQLTSLTTDQPGTTVFSNQSGVVTSGIQLYRDQVTLLSDTTLTSTGDGADKSTISFGGLVDGSGALTITARDTASFAGAVGSNTPLSSLVVNAGTARFSGPGVHTSGLQTYNGAAVLGSQADFTSDSDAVTFQGTVDGTSAGGTALSVNASGESAFNGNVGGGVPLGSLAVRGPLSIGGETVHTVDNQYYADVVAARPLVSTGTSLISDRADVRFDRAVTADGAFSVAGNRVGAGGDIVANGNLSLRTTGGGLLSPLLLLDGNRYSSINGSVSLNAPDAPTAPGSAPGSGPVLTSIAATIVLGNPGTTVISGTGFTMGYLEKLFSTGSLDIETRGGVATLSDLAARNSLRVSASEIVLLSRSGTSQVGRSDEGLNFVAGRIIDFGGARIVFADTDTNHTANFITTNGIVTIQRVAGVSLFKDANLDRQFQVVAALDLSVANLDGINPGNGGDVSQPAGGGSQALDTAAALSGALPDQKPLDVASDISISASQMEELKKLGIHPRLAKQAERWSAASKRALFAQLVDGQDAENYGRLQPIKGGVSRLEPSDFVVVVDRMGEREVQSILQEFGDLYGKNKEKAPAIGTAFQDAFNAYTVEKQTADASGFGDYLQGQPGRYPAVESAVRGFDSLFGHIEHLGLTDKEVAKSEEHITSDLGVSGLSPEDMVKVINGLRKKLPPAKKAASTKLPPAAPAGNPAPGASAPARPASPAAVAPASSAKPVQAATPAPASEVIPEIQALPETGPEALPPAPPAATPPPSETDHVLSTPAEPDPRRAVAIR